MHPSESCTSIHTLKQEQIISYREYQMISLQGNLRCSFPPTLCPLSQEYAQAYICMCMCTYTQQQAYTQWAYSQHPLEGSSEHYCRQRCDNPKGGEWVVMWNIGGSLGIFFLSDCQVFPIFFFWNTLFPVSKPCIADKHRGCILYPGCQPPPFPSLTIIYCKALMCC